MLKYGGKWSVGGYKSKILPSQTTTGLFQVKVYTPDGILKEVIPAERLIAERDEALKKPNTINKGSYRKPSQNNNQFFPNAVRNQNTQPKGVRGSNFERKPRQEKYHWTDEAKEKMMDWADGKTKISGTKMAKECGVSYHSFCWNVSQYRLPEQHKRQIKEVEGADDQSNPLTQEDKEHER